MYWIALLPTDEADRTAWGWRALRFTPRVAQVDEAIVLEIAASQRLWGGRGGLMRALLKESAPLCPARWGHGSSSAVALALLRLKLRAQASPARIPQDLPLDLLTAAQPHVPMLERTGCRTWGGLRALPRAGVARRFGAELLDALDAAYGDRPESFDWLELPEAFDMKVELVSLATTAPELMWAAQRLLTHLQLWLQARHRGVLALELEWTLDLRRLNGVKLPAHEQLAVRTAQPTQDIAHLRRLVGEHLARATLAAPASYLRLRSLETVPWGGANTSLLPEDNLKGERLHQLVERLSVRLGEGSVVMPRAVEDHRPERMQVWEPARSGAARGKGAVNAPSDALYPPWLLPTPLALEVRQSVPQYGGPLRRLTRLYRVETGWWEEGTPALRDYFIARSEKSGLVWIYCERALAQAIEHPKEARWYLQGLYA